MQQVVRKLYIEAVALFLQQRRDFLEMASPHPFVATLRI
jgi:hypothetical protein